MALASGLCDIRAVDKNVLYTIPLLPSSASLPCSSLTVVAQLLQFLSSNIVSVVFVVVTALASSYYVKRPRGAPPGPRGWHVVGSLFSLAGNHGGRYLKKLGEQYGPIFSLYVGARFSVILNDLELVQEAFMKQGNVTSARPETYISKICFAKDDGEVYGLLATQGRLWKVQRKFALSKLREFGMGKDSIEKKIQEEASACLAHLRDTKREPFDPEVERNTPLLRNIVLSKLPTDAEKPEQQTVYCIIVISITQIIVCG
ncbi:PREDICTED: cytochrome P450 2C23-like [Priapulus caudatus]|uniref:Cytochrome P450 2C23-like n=1 Tax=Priapulus caudatus TaxID=37621 RepID=A0ABM1ENA3_PRICU|nr:PREDICTED: cytochrome P450 2C23-like [Priapulus caudatus]